MKLKIGLVILAAIAVGGCSSINGQSNTDNNQAVCSLLDPLVFTEESINNLQDAEVNDILNYNEKRDMFCRAGGLK